METCWLVGATEIASQTVTIDGSPEVINRGTYYLAHASAPALLSQMVAAMTSAGVASPAAVITKARKVVLSSSGTFTVTWPADNILRNLLGFSGNLAAASSYTATNISPLLWSPGRTESTYQSRLGCQGHTVYAAGVGVADDGTTVVTVGGSRTYQTFRWSHIDSDRYQTSSELGGEWVKFWATVGVRGYNWHLYRGLDEDGTTSTMTLSGPLGPYACTPDGQGLDWDFARSTGFERADGRNDLEIKAHVVPELA